MNNPKKSVNSPSAIMHRVFERYPDHPDRLLRQAQRTDPHDDKITSKTKDKRLQGIQAVCLSVPFRGVVEARPGLRMANVFF
ncbi:MAG: hypothetical protein WED05_11745 [Candidatus Atabeyarchaeum deiterrae]